MKRTMTFAKRNLTEMSRDVLGYIFCVIFPVVMLVIMTLVNETIPPESNMTLFRIDRLTGAVLVFGQNFVMLFTAMNVATDRKGSFLIRLFASPMKSRDFTVGYILPMLLVSLIQALITLVAAWVIHLFSGDPLSPAGLCLSLLFILPGALFYTAIGMIFGTLLSDKAAPGICSVIISLSSFIGGLWFDVEAAGGVLYRISSCMPFLYCTKTARAVIAMDFSVEALWFPLAIVLGSAVVLTVAAVALFRRKMRADLA